MINENDMNISDLISGNILRNKFSEDLYDRAQNE